MTLSRLILTPESGLLKRWKNFTKVTTLSNIQSGSLQQVHVELEGVAPPLFADPAVATAHPALQLLHL
jgi:hypothetical protein